MNTLIYRPTEKHHDKGNNTIINPEQFTVKGVKITRDKDKSTEDTITVDMSFITENLTRRLAIEAALPSWIIKLQGNARLNSIAGNILWDKLKASRKWSGTIDNLSNGSRQANPANDFMNRAKYLELDEKLKLFESLDKDTKNEVREMIAATQNLFSK